MFLAVRNILQEKLRFALSVGDVALALMLMLFLGGFLSGVYRQAAFYLDNTAGSVAVAPPGVSSFLGASSLLPAGTEAVVRQVDGVALVSPVLSVVVIPEYHGTKEAAFVVGYEPGRGGGPWRLTRGREPQGDSEVVIDRVLAGRHGFGVGDQIAFAGRQFTISGLSDQTTTWLYSIAFVRKSALEPLLLAPGGTSFLFVTPGPGVSPAVLRDRLRALPGVDVLLKPQLEANDATLLGRVFDAPLKLMVAVAFLVGVLVVGLVVYTATIERQREYGLLKAIGARNARLYRVVMVQALAAAVAGGLGAIGLAFALARLVMTLRPQFLIAIEPLAIAEVFVAGLAMALIAALLPARTLARLAPADVFRR